MSRGRTTMANLILAVSSVLTGVLLVEMACRILGLAPTYSTVDHDLRIRFDTRLLYRVVPSAGRPDINRAGYRDREFARRRPGRRRAIVLGDSFVMGENVAPDGTLPRALERHLGPGWEAYNLGIKGYGPDQSYLQLIDDGLRWEPDLVVLALYPANDFNDLYKNRLLRWTASGELAWNPRNVVADALPRLRSYTLLRQAVTGHAFPESVERDLQETLFSDDNDILVPGRSPAIAWKLATMRQVLLQFRESLRRARVGFVVLVIPTYESIENDREFRDAGLAPRDYFVNEEHAERLCSELGITFLSLRQTFLDHRLEHLYDAGNGHWGNAGIERAATLLGSRVGSL